MQLRLTAPPSDNPPTAASAPTPGTAPRPEVRLFRPLAALTQALGAVYLAWRALRTLNPGWAYFYR